MKLRFALIMCATVMVSLMLFHLLILNPLEKVMTQSEARFTLGIYAIGFLTVGVILYHFV